MSNALHISPVGQVVRKDGDIQITIDSAYKAALKGLDTFSHVAVFWWADRLDNAEGRKVLVTPLPYAEGHEAGVFSSRSPSRPNPIMVTICEILAVDTAAGVVRIRNMDAYNGTPVIDLKPYYPVTDRVRNARISPFLVGWPEWFPDEGMGLQEGEQ